MARRKPPKYAMAYDIVMSNPVITPAEKLVLFEVARYWPNPWMGSNATIAQDTGLSKRYVEDLLKRLFEKQIIRRGLTTINRHGNPYTYRTIIVSCLPKYSLQDTTLLRGNRPRYNVVDDHAITVPNKEKIRRENKNKPISFERIRRSGQRTLNAEKSLGGNLAAARKQKELLGIA